MSIYLDHAATVPMVDAAITALNDQMRAVGNASSLHSDGRAVRKAVEDARLHISEIAGCEASEIIFTGTGTEADNLAVKGFFWKAIASDPQRRIILTSPIEHHAIKDPIEWLSEHDGAEVAEIPVDARGVIDIDWARTYISANSDRIALISVMHSNNEIGSLQPIAELVQAAGDIPVHSDAVQSFGKIDFNFVELGLTAATISSHKIGGPLGVAALILRRGLDLTPVTHGGGQERDVRSGTFNAPSIVAFAAAAREAAQTRKENFKKVSHLRDQAKAKLQAAIPGSVINGEPGLPGILNMRFPNTESEALLLLLDSEGISASAGSACSAGVARPSHVLLALGCSEAEAMSSLRFSFGTTSTEGDVQRLVEVLPSVVQRAQAAFSVKK
jgi:cysteine desulfurase